MISRRNAIASSFAGLLTQSHDATADVKVDDQPTLDKLHEMIKGLSDALRAVRMTSPPIGSVQAFPGEWPPFRPDGERETELELGWLLCDSRSLDFVEQTLLDDWKKQPENAHKSPPQVPFLRDLRAALTLLVGGKPTPPITLPDYRGYFLRGVDSSIVGETTGRDKDGVRRCGTSQAFTTAMPTKEHPFLTDKKGKHTHPLKMVNDAVSDNGDERARVIDRPDLVAQGRFAQLPIEADGEHAHAIESGGDLETRPINVAVYWIIKFR